MPVPAPAAGAAYVAAGQAASADQAASPATTGAPNRTAQYAFAPE